MKKIVLGFIAFGLLTLAGCKKDDDMDTTEKTETSNGDESGDQTNTNSDEENTKDEITDGDGNVYGFVTIGTQIWMSENLKTSKYSDGTSIPNVTDGVEWGELETGAWCHYDNDNQYDTIYGKLYNFYVVETEELCPTGWHVPTDAEWTVLTDYLAANGHDGKEGRALKSTSGWVSIYSGITGNGTDDYGWLGLPGGDRYDDGDFGFISDDGSWWSSSQSDTDNTWYRGLGTGVDIVARKN